jgi:hypothetical protein
MLASILSEEGAEAPVIKFAQQIGLSNLEREREVLHHQEICEFQHSQNLY